MKALVTLFFILSILTPALAVEKAVFKGAGLQQLEIEAPDFTIAGKDGERINLKGLKGGVVFLHLWATWCKPCKEEFPQIEKLYKAHKGRAVTLLPVAIDSKATQEEIDSFARSLGASFPVYLKGDMSAKYWTWGVPTTYLIDKRGKIVGRALGPRDWSSKDVYDLIEALLKE
ncbi:MAG: TlpA family protein disulfide reductase [Deltaproteobacteria bacterium]|nr:TlpA family protein disulfide reductase [Deltaproteobacteria bacterium]